MVLLLKQWKSRSSPGFAGGGDKRPIRNVDFAAVETISQRRFCFSPIKALRFDGTRSWRGVEQPGSSSGS